MIPTLLGEAWKEVPADAKFDYWKSGKNELTQRFVAEHNVIGMALPIEPQYNKRLLNTLVGNDEQLAQILG